MAAEFELSYARATVAHLLAELFCEPGAALAARLADERLIDEFAACSEAIGLPRAAVRELAACREPLDALIDRYAALFGHSVRGECPLYEMEYARGEVFQQSHMLADVAGFYRAFGLAVDERTCERVDHAAAEWEFLAVCALKEARAGMWASGAEPPPPDVDAATAVETCRDAQRAFIRDHAAAWMPALFARVRKNDADGFYGRCAALGEALLRQWCERFGVAYGPEWLELRPFDEEDMAIECGPGREPGRAELGPGLAAALNG